MAIFGVLPSQAVTTCNGYSFASSVSRLERRAWNSRGQPARPAREDALKLRPQIAVRPAPRRHRLFTVLRVDHVFRAVVRHLERFLEDGPQFGEQRNHSARPCRDGVLSWEPSPRAVTLSQFTSDHLTDRTSLGQRRPP